MKLANFIPKLLTIALISTLMATQGLEGYLNYSLLFKPNPYKIIPKNIVKSAFLPNLASHNVLTFYNLSEIAPNDLQVKTSIRDLTYAIHDNYKGIKDGTFVTINGISEAPARYFQVAKGVHIPQDTSYITLYSGGFARESRPLKPTEEPNALYKIINMLIPGFQVRGLPQKGGGALFTYIEMRENLIHTPCICFDYPDNNKTANFAQSADLDCLKNIFSALPEHVEKLGMGTSRGATALLKYFLRPDAPKADAIILESPFLSLQETIKRLVKTTLYSLPFPSYLILSGFNWLYPSYKIQEDDLYSTLVTLSKDCAIKDTPLFIVHLLNDTYVPNESMFFMVRSLAKINPNVHFLVLNDPSKKARHGKLSMCKTFQQAVNSFYKKYSLPYNEQLALEGEELLENAFNNAYVKDFDKVIITQTSQQNQLVTFKEFELKDK